MKTILHVINTLDLGGTETVLYRLLCHMPRDNYAFAVIALRGEGYYSSKIEALGIPVYHLTLKKTNLIRTYFRLISLIKKIQPDIVQTWLYHSDVLGGLAAKHCGVQKIIWSIRCEGQQLKRATAWVKRIGAWLSPYIPHCITTNSSVAIAQHIQAGYQAQKMQVLYNGFNPHCFAPNKPASRCIGEQSFAEEALVIGTLARFHPDKGYETLIRAIDTVCASHPLVYFVFCGRGCNQDNHELRTMIQSLIYPDRVLLMDGTDKPADYLNQLDIFILPSMTEAFPNSLAEAMLCERPCIATHVGDVKTILGNTGLLVPPGSYQKLANACISLIQKPEDERKRMGTLARRSIEERYSMTRYVENLTAIYEKRIRLCVD